METDKPEQVALPNDQSIVTLGDVADLEPAQKVEQDEIVDYLMDTIRLAKKKTKSKKLPDVVKVKWCKVAVDASKTLLFSGVLDRREKKEVSTLQAFFMSIRKGDFGVTG